MVLPSHLIRHPAMPSDEDYKTACKGGPKIRNCKFFRKFADMKSRIGLILTMILCSVCSCSHHMQSERSPYTESLQLLIEKCNNFRNIGHQDSVAALTLPYLKRSLITQDSAGVQVSGTFLIQALVLLDRPHDSTIYWLNRIDPYMKNLGKLEGLANIYWTAKGHIALKYSLDYSSALSAYLNSLEIAQRRNKPTSQIAALFNIVNIFYTRHDPNGLTYAEKALETASSDEVDNFHKIAAYVSMSQMLYLMEEYTEAQKYLAQATVLRSITNSSYWDPIFAMLTGDLMSATGRYDDAERQYKAALANRDKAEPALTAQTYLHYGELCEKMSDVNKAILLYAEGIRISDETHNLEYRKELLARTADLLYETGRQQLSSRYYNQLLEFIDSLYLENKEHALNRALLSYTETMSDLEIARQSALIYKMRANTLLLLFVITILLLLSVLMIIMYVKQRRYNTQTVRHYQEYNKKLAAHTRQDESASGDGSGQQDFFKDLFIRIEEQMRQGAYRDNSLSLEKIAAVLASNRTYVSNAINKIAGQSFSEYVNSYRIKEATDILADPDRQDLHNIKELSHRLGFSNTQAFYYVFKKETGVTPGVYKTEILRQNKAKRSG